MLRVVLPSVGFYTQAAVHLSLAAARSVRGRLGNPELVAGSHALRRALERVGVRFEVTGAETLDPAGGPFVFVANHMSALETQILPSILHAAAPCTFVVKPSLLRLPVFGPVLRAFDPIVVTRADPRDDLRRVVDGGTARLRNGVSVIVFPQGHRSPEFRRRDFNSIGMRLARAAGVPMIPIALETATWAQGRLISEVGWIEPALPVRFAIGPPVPVDGNGVEAHRRVVDYVEAHLEEWARKDGAGWRAPVAGENPSETPVVQAGSNGVMPGG